MLRKIITLFVLTILSFNTLFAAGHPSMLRTAPKGLPMQATISQDKHAALIDMQFNEQAAIKYVIIAHANLGSNHYKQMQKLWAVDIFGNGEHSFNLTDRAANEVNGSMNYKFIIVHQDGHKQVLYSNSVYGLREKK
jgi:hypothetical protein